MVTVAFVPAVFNCVFTRELSTVTVVLARPSVVIPVVCMPALIVSLLIMTGTWKESEEPEEPLTDSCFMPSVPFVLVPEKRSAPPVKAAAPPFPEVPEDDVQEPPVPPEIVPLPDTFPVCESTPVPPAPPVLVPVPPVPPLDFPLTLISPPVLAVPLPPAP